MVLFPKGEDRSRGRQKKPPPERLEKLYQALLDAGHNFAGTGGATLAVDPRNGHLYLQKYNWLDRLDVEKAVTGLTRFADMVKLWKGLVAETVAHAPVASDVLSAPTPGAFMQV